MALVPGRCEIMDGGRDVDGGSGVDGGRDVDGVPARLILLCRPGRVPVKGDDEDSSPRTSG